MKQKGKLVWLLFIHISITNISLQVFAQEKPTVKLGGALRFQYNYSNWKEDNKNKGGDFAYDVFRLNTNVVYKKLQLIMKKAYSYFIIFYNNREIHDTHK